MRSVHLFLPEIDRASVTDVNTCKQRSSFRWIFLLATRQFPRIFPVPCSTKVNCFTELHVEKFRRKFTLMSKQHICQKSRTNKRINCRRHNELDQQCTSSQFNSYLITLTTYFLKKSCIFICHVFTLIKSKNKAISLPVRFLKSYFDRTNLPEYVKQVACNIRLTTGG